MKNLTNQRRVLRHDLIFSTNQVPGRGDEGEAEQQEQVGRVSHEGDGGMDVNLFERLFDSSQDHIFLQDVREPTCHTQNSCD